MSGNATTVDHQLAVDTIRTLSIDGVQQANSGHPGRAHGRRADGLRAVDPVPAPRPTRPDWFDRDRFVLSAGHASMLLYSLLHLTGYDLPLDELKRFRQLGSRTPGHPEYGLTPGVEATTGPLGQGFANAVGMAIAERRLAAEFDRPGHDIIDHWTYGICSDGDLQEGIASEAASLAGHLRLGKLVVPLRRQPHPARRADDDGLERGRHGPLRRLRLAHPARGRRQRPRRHRGGHHGRPRGRPTRASSRCAPTSASARPTGQDTQKAHGAPLGPDEVRLTKEAYGWDPDRTFYIPDAALAHFRAAVPRRRGARRRVGAALRRPMPRPTRRAGRRAAAAHGRRACPPTGTPTCPS